MLLRALAAWAGVSLRAVGHVPRLELRCGMVQVEGDFDFRGTLAVDKQTAVGFQQVRVRITVDNCYGGAARNTAASDRALLRDLANAHPAARVIVRAVPGRIDQPNRYLIPGSRP